MLQKPILKNLISLSILCLNNCLLEGHEIHSSQGNRSIATDVATQNRIVRKILLNMSFKSHEYKCTPEQSAEGARTSQIQSGLKVLARAPEHQMQHPTVKYNIAIRAGAKVP